MLLCPENQAGANLRCRLHPEEPRAPTACPTPDTDVKISPNTCFFYSLKRTLWLPSTKAYRAQGRKGPHGATTRLYLRSTFPQTHLPPAGARGSVVMGPQEHRSWSSRGCLNRVCSSTRPGSISQKVSLNFGVWCFTLPQNSPLHSSNTSMDTTDYLFSLLPQSVAPPSPCSLHMGPGALLP